MKIKSYTALIIFILCFALCLGGCGKSRSPALDPEKLNVICTNFPAYDFVRQIGGQRVNAVLLVPPGAESHSFEPTAQDMTALIGCGLIVANGGVGESWLDSLISGGEVTAPVLRMMDYVNLYEEEHREGMQSAGHTHEHDESCGHEEHEHMHENAPKAEDHGDTAHEAEYDEHVWTSPVNAALICRGISGALSLADPEGADLYAAAADSYCTALEALDSRFRAVVDAAPRRTMIFADRFPVRYFVEEYGLEYFAAFPGCAEDTEPSAKTVAFLIDKVRQEDIGAVYYIEFSNEKMADVIVEDTGCKKLLFHSCHTVGADQLESGVTYLQLMEQNLENLREGLSR